MISIVFPNYNGIILFQKYMAHNLALFQDAGITDIIVSDDASTDGSLAFLEKEFPTIKCISAPKNQGFGATANRGIAAAKEPYVFLLNTDMAFRSFQIRPMLEHFQNNPDLFALTPPVYRKTAEGEINESFTTGWFEGGWMRLENNPKAAMTPKPLEGTPLLWACGGAMLFDKDKFKQIGGFDDIYLPFYVEDADLSYNAWKRGWSVAYTEYCPIDHQHQSTIGTFFKKAYVTQIHLRNQYLFMWKNLTDISFIASHMVTVLIKLVTFQMRDCKAIFAALKRWPQVMKKRAQLPAPKQRDKDVLSHFYKC